MHKLPKALSKSAILPWEEGLNINVCELNSPSISIVMPVFNSGEFIEQTIRSILCNDMNGVELILMDGGSTDSTIDIVKHYEEHFTITHSAPDKGQSDAINKGYEKANGQILYWLNGDDLLLPNTLNAVRSYFSQHVSCDVLVGNAYMTELDLSPINHFVFSDDKLTFDYLLDYASHHLVQPSVFFEELGFKYFGPVDGHDLDLVMDTLLVAKETQGPVIVHCLTEKGKGYQRAENDFLKLHAVGKFDPATGKNHPGKPSGPSYTKVFTQALAELAKQDERIVAVTAAMLECLLCCI